MSEIVCQVGSQAGQVEFIWSSRGGYFKPYVVSGVQASELRHAADRTRAALESLVFAFNQEGTATPWEPSFELAEAGFRLFNSLLPPEDETAKKVRRWLEEVRNQASLIGLEIVVEERSADAKGFLSVPWNLVYDERPAKYKAAFREGGGVERWRPFWSARYNLTSARRVEPLKRSPTWVEPRVVVVVDPTVHMGLGDDQRGRLDAFLAEAGLTAVGSMGELEAALEEGYPRLLYWLGHATPDYLRLGDERIAPGDLRNLLRSFDDRERPEGMLAFLNACQTAEAGSGGSFLDVLHSFGFTGAVATERQTIDNFANEFGLAFLQGFLRDGKPLGELLHELRLQSAPLGLLYGAHCPPEITVRPANGIVDVLSPLPILESRPVAGVALGAAATEGGRKRRRDRRSHWGPSVLSPVVVPALPEQPYCSLAFYDEKDRALFTGRDADVLRFAATLDQPDTRILILHGESGLGKSSFLRAGVIPYLERECVGYRFFRRPDGSLMFVQAAKDLLGGLAQALLDATAAPLRYDTPDGEPLTISLRRHLDEALGSPAAYATLREALRGDVNLLADVLARMASRVPHALVLVIDQAEEVFTLARTPEEVAGRDHALRVLQRLVDVTADVKLILSLRTEYYGRLLDHLRAGRRDLTGVRDDLLRDLSRASVIEAITRPASEMPLGPGQPSPRETYSFRYAEGIPGLIADGVQALRSENQDSVLPLVQVICTQLYERETTQPGMDGVITREDLDAIKGVEGGLKAFAEDALGRSLRLGPGDREAFKRLFSQLYNRQPDGTLTTWLMPRESLERQWKRPTTFADILEAAKTVRLLREDELRIEGDGPRRYLRLGHDALAKVAAEWAHDAERRARVRKVIAAVAGSLALAAIMLVLAVLAWSYARDAQERRREAQVVSATLAMDRGQSLCEQGDVAGGLVWLAHSLGTVPRQVDDLERVIRANLGAWLPHLSHLRQVLPSEHGVQSVAFHPSGRLVATAGFSRTVRMWDAETGEAHGTPLAHPGYVLGLAYSHDGRMIATGCEDGKVRLWDVATQQPLREPLSHGGNIYSIAFSPDDRLILTGSQDHTARLWSVETRGPIGEPMTHVGEVTAVAFTRDGEHAVTASWDSKVRFWDASTAQPASLATVDHGSAIRCIALSPDGKAILVGGMDRQARLWSLKTGRLIREYGPHPGAIYGVTFSPDGSRVLTGANDGAARLWDAATGRPVGSLLKHQAWVTSVAFDPKGRAILTGSGDRTARVWDYRPPAARRPTMRHEGSIHRGEFSPDGKVVITAGDDKAIRFWNAGDGSPYSPPILQEYPARSIALSSDGTVLLSSSDKTLHVWDVRKRAPAAVPIPHPKKISAIAIHPDGKLAATGCFDGMVRVWSLATGGRVTALDCGDLAWGLAFDPARGRLAIGTNDGTCRLLDYGTGEVATDPIRHNGAVVALGFNADGTRIASGSDEHVVRIWIPGHGDQRCLRLPTGTSAHAIEFGTGDRFFLTGSIDGEAQLWDLATEKPIGGPMKHDAGIFSVRLSPDGRSILTTSFDRTARIWEVPPPPLRGDARSVTLWVQGLTGLELRDGGAMAVLDFEAWKRCQRLLPEMFKTAPTDRR